MYAENGKKNGKKKLQGAKNAKKKPQKFLHVKHSPKRLTEEKKKKSANLKCTVSPERWTTTKDHKTLYPQPK